MEISRPLSARPVARDESGQPPRRRPPGLLDWLSVATRSAFAGLPRFQRGAFALFVTAALVTAMLGDQPVGRTLLLHPAGLSRGEGLWQPLTAAFIFPEGQGGGLVFTLVVQWFLASSLESFWGTRKYLALVLGCSLAGYVCTALLGLVVPAVAAVSIGGAAPLDLAAVVAFGVVYGRRPMQLLGFVPLSARGIAALAVAVAILSPLARGAGWPEILPHLVSMGCALGVTTQPWRRLRSSGKVRMGRAGRKSRHLKVVSDDRQLLN